MCIKQTISCKFLFHMPKFEYLTKDFLRYIYENIRYINSFVLTPILGVTKSLKKEWKQMELLEVYLDLEKSFVTDFLP